MYIHFVKFCFCYIFISTYNLCPSCGSPGAKYFAALGQALDGCEGTGELSVWLGWRNRMRWMAGRFLLAVMGVQRGILYYVFIYNEVRIWLHLMGEKDDLMSICPIGGCRCSNPPTSLHSQDIGELWFLKFRYNWMKYCSKNNQTNW